MQSVSACQRVSVSACQRVSVSACQRVSVSSCEHFSNNRECAYSLINARMVGFMKVGRTTDSLSAQAWRLSSNSGFAIVFACRHAGVRVCGR